jgi:hypothetical protein
MRRYDDMLQRCDDLHKVRFRSGEMGYTAQVKSIGAIF